MVQTMRVVYTNDDAERVVVDLPSSKQVYPLSAGNGVVLCEGMRGAAEFEETFDEEQAAEYFRIGGRYDVNTAEQRHYESWCTEQDSLATSHRIEEEGQRTGA